MAKMNYSNGNKGGKRPPAENQSGNVTKGKTEMGKTDYKSQATSKSMAPTNSMKTNPAGSGKVSW